MFPIYFFRQFKQVDLICSLGECLMFLKIVKSRLALCVFVMINANAAFAENQPSDIAKNSSQDVLAQTPIVTAPISLTSPTGVFQTPNDIESIFQVLKNLEFEQVPDASLMSPVEPVTANSNTQNQTRNTPQNRSEQKNKPAPATTNRNNTPETVSKTILNEIEQLKRQNERLTQENSSLKQNQNVKALNVVANQILKDFSREQVEQNTQIIKSLEAKIETAQTEVKLRDAEIAKLNTLPIDSDEKLKKQIEVADQKVKEIQQKYNALETQLNEQRQQFESELAKKTNELNQVQTALNQLSNAKTRNQAIAEELSTQLANVEAPFKNEIERLSHEALVLKKAYQEEKQRADEAILALNEFSAQAKVQINSLQQQSQNSNQGQAQQLLQLQQRAQLAELNTQKLQQKLQISESKTIELEEAIAKLNAQMTKNSQSYQLQLTDLQQRLLNARRAEQEANRWARAAGSGNTNAASNRIINLQQQIDQISAAEEAQRVMALQKQQEVINLQNQINSMQAELTSQQQSRMQLENQIKTLETEKNQTETKPVANKVKEAMSTAQQSESKAAENPKNKLSTNAGIKGI